MKTVTAFEKVFLFMYIHLLQRINQGPAQTSSVQTSSVPDQMNVAQTILFDLILEYLIIMLIKWPVDLFINRSVYHFIGTGWALIHIFV
jgi:hypothetical protein